MRMEKRIKTQTLRANAEIPMNKRPNIIHIMGKHNIIHTPEGGAKTRNGNNIEPNAFYGTVDPTGVFGLVWTISTIQRISSSSKVVNTNYGEILNKFRLP
jgi:hypothetical protein